MRFDPIGIERLGLATPLAAKILFKCLYTITCLTLMPVFQIYKISCFSLKHHLFTLFQNEMTVGIAAIVTWIRSETVWQ